MQKINPTHAPQSSSDLLSHVAPRIDLAREPYSPPSVGVTALHQAVRGNPMGTTNDGLGFAFSS